MKWWVKQARHISAVPEVALIQQLSCVVILWTQVSKLSLIGLIQKYHNTHCFALKHFLNFSLDFLLFSSPLISSTFQSYHSPLSGTPGKFYENRYGQLLAYDFKWQGWSKGAKRKPQKIFWASNQKTKKIPELKINPRQKSHAEFPSVKNSQMQRNALTRVVYHESSDSFL